MLLSLHQHSFNLFPVFLISLSSESSIAAHLLMKSLPYTPPPLSPPLDSSANNPPPPSQLLPSLQAATSKYQRDSLAGGLYAWSVHASVVCRMDVGLFVEGSGRGLGAQFLLRSGKRSAASRRTLRRKPRGVRIMQASAQEGLRQAFAVDYAWRSGLITLR